MGNFFRAILNNKILVCGVSGWAVAQVLKTIIYALVNRELRWERMVGDGGMPLGDGQCHGDGVRDHLWCAVL